MKKISFLTLLLSGFCCVTSYAEEVFSRGYVIAVDTRIEAACKIVQQKVGAFTTANVSDVCKLDDKNPYSVIVVTLPIDEFEFSAEADSLQNNSTEITAGKNSSDSAIYVLPKYKEFDHYLRFTSHHNQAAITFSRHADFGSMAENGNRRLIIPFIMKSNSEASYGDESAVSSSVHDFIVLNRGVYAHSQSRYLYILGKQADVIDIITEVVASHANDRVIFEFFSPDRSFCAENVASCGKSKFNLGLNVKINF